jgi:hypothetical protein
MTTVNTEVPNATSARSEHQTLEPRVMFAWNAQVKIWLSNIA